MPSFKKSFWAKQQLIIFPLSFWLGTVSLSRLDGLTWCAQAPKLRFDCYPMYTFDAKSNRTEETVSLRSRFRFSENESLLLEARYRKLLVIWPIAVRQCSRFWIQERLWSKSFDERLVVTHKLWAKFKAIASRESCRFWNSEPGIWSWSSSEHRS